MMFKHTHRPIARPGFWVSTALIAFLAACGGSNERAKVEIKGSDPTSQQSRPVQQPTNTGPSTPDPSGIVTYDGYQTAVARQGDTVADVAGRVGMSASELGAYNGLQPNYTLRAGDELVLPQRPAGTGTPGQTVAQIPQQDPLATTPGQRTTSIESRPLDGTAVANDGTVAATDPVEETPTPDVTDQDVAQADTDAATSQAPTEFNPALIADAIDRSTGLQKDGSLGAPPSSNEPVPPEPEARRELKSPDLSQYQTPETKPTGDTAQQTPAVEPTEETQVAAADPAPARQPKAPAGLKLRRPVKGPVAIGFNKGSGPQRNDGVDFAAPAGAPVVAAADGEVALVSQSLGGLGTIVLVRHPDEILTVYGRVDDVNVKKGDIIQRGQKIGVVSNAAAPAEPRMHFEVRRGAESLDPMQFL